MKSIIRHKAVNSMTNYHNIYNFNISLLLSTKIINFSMAFNVICTG